MNGREAKVGSRFAWRAGQGRALLKAAERGPKAPLKGSLAEMLWPLDTVAKRWDMLAPFVRAYGPADEEPRPAVLLFHGCAGVRPHIYTYAQAAASTSPARSRPQNMAPEQTRVVA